MQQVLPDGDAIETALALAVPAPSIRNTQPWRWRIGDGAVHLFLDPERATTSAERDAVLSCGAALHHLRVAFAALGWSAVVRRLPDPADPGHLAAVELVRHRPTKLDAALSAAISCRQSDRRPFASSPIQSGYVTLATERAGGLGAVVRLATGPARDRLIEAAWLAMGRPAEPRDRVDEAELLVVGTAADDRLSRLRAGEAMSAVLLTAANVGLATCPLTETLESARARRKLLGYTANPQVIIRIGRALDVAEPLPFTSRRGVDDVLETRACEEGAYR
ncbi:nitroreductase family protein [Nocardia tenerifensis]|uniref:Nitroreductase family protein n=1 Tax=Nocardia tenerifensis TaxID=228006 RepID=A0A318KF08_9NOCA|nr:nitroreductase family protein [Nocardia tenerifensis]PXX71409.1 nitroreductase family protein [Nocardia tenerifensis]